MKELKKILTVIILSLMFPDSIEGRSSMHYDSSHMSSAMATVITQDGEGYIWIGTDYGLNRFDGISFREYLHEESQPGSIKSNTVRSLFCDRESRLWIGFINGMQCYDQNRDEFLEVSFDTTPYTPNISSIIQLSSGELWTIASLLGPYSIDTENMTASALVDLIRLCGTNNITSIYEDNERRLWVSTYNKGVVCIDPSHTKVIDRYFENEEPTLSCKITQSMDNIIIMALNDRLWRFDEADESFIELNQSKETALEEGTLLVRKDGDIIIYSTTEGMWRINKSTWTLEEHHIAYPQDLYRGNIHITSMSEDKDDNLWCTCMQNGIIMIPPPINNTQGSSFRSFNLTSFKDYDYNICGSISAIFKDSSAQLWCGTHNGFLFRYNDKGQNKSVYELNGIIQEINEDKNGNIYIGTRRKGMIILNPETGSTHSVRELKDKSISSIVVKDDETMYLSAFGDGIWTYNIKNGDCERLQVTDEANYRLLRNRNINKMMVDRKGNLWIGHFLGIACYDTETGKFLDMANDSLINSSVCFALAQGKDGSIWIGTDNGLFDLSIENGTYKRYKTSDGLSSDMICGLAEDKEGNIWCSTVRGINCINTKDGKITSWHANNGRSKREFIRSCYQTKDNTIYFAEKSQVTYFEPPLSIGKKLNDIKLTGIHINNKSIPAGEYDGTIRFKHNENTFTMEFSTMSYTENSIRIHYRLKNKEEGWHMTRHGVNQIALSHLKPGRYILEAYAETNSMVSETGSWEILIHNPWYFGTLAKIVYCILLILALIAAYLGIKRKQSLKMSENKLNMYANLAHEIRSPMVMIINPIDNLLSTQVDPETIHALTTVKRNTNRIIRMVDQFLDVRRLDKGQMQPNMANVDLISCISNSLSVFSYQAKKQSISLSFVHPFESLIFNIDPNNLDIIIYNLVSNAFKFTPDHGEITVSLNIEKGNVVIKVMDTGTGIDSKDLKKVFNRFYQSKTPEKGIKGFGIGLNLCQMLIKLHDGSITASNRTDRSGAIFTVSLPGAEDIAKNNAAETETPEKRQIYFKNTDSSNNKTKKRRVETVLVVDDDDEIRSYLEERLSESYKTATADNGTSGLQKALKDLPDIIISDIRMPGLDGYQLVKRLKTNPNTNHIPIILLTAKNELDDRIAGLDQGADAYMPKPFHITELEYTIDNLLKNRQRMKGKYSGAHQEDKIKTIELKSDDEVLMERIMKIVNQNLDNNQLKVEMLAKEVGLSRVQLHRRLKEITGISTSEFIRNLRLKKAAELLAEKKVNISQIAYMVGFSSHTHFCTAFKKAYGVSPTEYMNKD